MANPFDAFDPLPQQPATQPQTQTGKGPNPFDAFDPPAGTQPTPVAVATPGTPAQRPPDWSIANWSHGGDVTLPQSVQDFGNVAGEQASAGVSLPMARAESQAKGQPLDLQTQLAQLAAAKARLGPVASGVADTLGYYASPTTLLNAIPYAGGGLAGATHEGLKSYFEGGDVAGDTLKGGISGLVGTGIAHTLASPSVVSKLIDAGGTGVAATLAHTAFGGSPTAGILGGNMASRWVQPAVKWTEENSSPLLNALRPYLAAAIQGPASALQQSPGNFWGQWMTGS